MDRVTEDFTAPLLCMKCGQEGTVTWEPGRFDPVGASTQFYLRIKVRVKVPQAGIEIVCARCGAIHRDRLPRPGLGTRQARKHHAKSRI